MCYSATLTLTIGCLCWRMNWLTGAFSNLTWALGGAVTASNIELSIFRRGFKILITLISLISSSAWTSRQGCIKCRIRPLRSFSIVVVKWRKRGKQEKKDKRETNPFVVNNLGMLSSRMKKYATLHLGLRGE